MVLIIPLVETVSSVVLFKLTLFGLDHGSNTDLDSPPNGSDIEPSVITKQGIEMECENDVDGYGPRDFSRIPA